MQDRPVGRCLRPDIQDQHVTPEQDDAALQAVVTRVAVFELVSPKQAKASARIPRGLQARNGDCIVEQLKTFRRARNARRVNRAFANPDAVEPQCGNRRDYEDGDDFQDRHDGLGFGCVPESSHFQKFPCEMVQGEAPSIIEGAFRILSRT